MSDLQKIEPKPNYDLLMCSQMKNIRAGTPLLLHSCCAPCSSRVLERIRNHFEISLFFFNPNITEEGEYSKRLEELYRFTGEFSTKYPVHIIEGRYAPEEFFYIAKGLEDEPERGRRCKRCYFQRMEETRRVADKLGFKYFTTTLSLSPHKNAGWINEIGQELGQEYTSDFLYSDFKKKGGYIRSIELSGEYDLYRQDYCGCIYSKLETERKRAKKADNK